MATAAALVGAFRPDFHRILQNKTTPRIAHRFLVSFLAHVFGRPSRCFVGDPVTIGERHHTHLGLVCVRTAHGGPQQEAKMFVLLWCLPLMIMSGAYDALLSE
jgi:hypothetical protein